MNATLQDNPAELVTTTSPQRAGDDRRTGERRRSPIRFTGTVGKSSLSKTDLLVITTQLSIMTRAGMDLADAVRQLSVQSQNPKVRDILGRVHQDLNEGRSFSAALNAQSHIFGDSYVATIAAGESSGKLVEVFARQKDLLRNEVRMQSAIRGALMYPAILMLVAFAVVNALVFFVLPQFDKVFRNMNAPTPAITQCLLDTGSFVRGHFVILGLLLAAAAGGAYYFRSTPTFRRFRDRALLQTRGLRAGTQALFTGRVLRLVATMLQSGVPLLDAIRLCRRSINSILFHELFDRMEDEILTGGGMAGVLAKASFVPRGAAEMIATAERSGDLGAVMELVGEFYEDEGERRVRDLVKLLEPAIIVVMGAFVALVVASVMLPLFDLSSTSTF